MVYVMAQKQFLSNLMKRIFILEWKTTLKKLPLLVQFFIFETPTSPQNWCESQWFEINVDLGVGRGKRRQSSFFSKTVKCSKSSDQGCSYRILSSV